MTVQNATLDQSASGATRGDGSFYRIRWAALANGDSGAPLAMGEWADRSIHVWAQTSVGGASVLGAGGSVSIEGSNDYDPVTNTTGSWIALTDQNGVVMTYTAAALKQMTEAPLWIRPRVTAGDGTTSCNVVLCARRIQPMIAR